MLPRRAITPEGHWQIGIPLNHNQGLQCGPLVFVGGQVDLDPEGRQLNPGDLDKQAASVIAHVKTVLAGAEAEASDLVKLTVFYESDVR